MQSTMQDVPLTIDGIRRHGTTVHGTARVLTMLEGGGTRSASYAEVGRRAAQLANALRRLGVTGDERVGTFMWNNQEHLEAYLAVPSMGAVLHTLNIRLFPEQLTYVVNHGEDKVIICDASLVPLLAKVIADLKTVETVLVVGEADTSPLSVGSARVLSYDEELARESEEFDWPELDEKSAAAMCYTSGTTGNPKGVVYSHRSTYLHSMAVCMSSGFGLSMSDRVLAIVPMFHANSWGLPYAALTAGADLLMPDRFLQAAPLLALIQEEEPTLSAAVPTIWNEILRLVDRDGGDLSSLRAVICGGSAVPRSLMEAFQSRHGLQIIQAWGMTETSPIGSVAWVPRGAEDEWAYRTTAGRFVCGVEGRVVSDDVVLPSDGSAVGEVEVRGPWITGSYYRDDDPSKFHDGWLRTGDVGSIDEMGYFTISDRSKDVIKSGGEWISSVDLENDIMGHPDVVEAAVVAIPDPKWEERPLAAVVLREGAVTTADELRDFLADKVAKWQLPERWTFVDVVPKTSVGKFDKKVIRKRYADGELDVTEVGVAAAKPAT